VPTTSQQSLWLTGASRADLGVRCTANTNDDNSPVATLSWGGVVVAYINVNSSLPSDSYASPYDENGNTWVPSFPYYLSDMSNETDVLGLCLFLFLFVSCEL
jgi:hypothetical protein